MKAQYPKRMVNNIIDKVKSLPRIIKKNDSQQNTPIPNHTPKINIKVISTHGRDKPLTDIIETIPNKHLFQFNHTKRAAPSLNSILCRTKGASLGPKYGPTEKCHKPRCKCCKLVTNSTIARVTIKGRRKIIRTGKGTCTTRNVIYLAVCKCCRKYYIGKTIQELHARTNQHRSSFLKYAKSRGKWRYRIKTWIHTL